MAERTINLRDLLILVADPSPFLCLLIHGMLRGFGANKVLEVRDSPGVLETLNTHKIDVLLCDGALPPHGGFALTRTIRRNPNNENRTMPVLLMTSDHQGRARRRRQHGGGEAAVAGEPL